MKKNIFCILLFLLINHAILNLSKERRKELLNRYTKEIRNLKEEESYNMINLQTNIKLNKVIYDFNKIKNLIEANSFPQTYNFIDKEKPEIFIKDQGHCGVCWATSTTTALGYRFHKKGIKDLELSPQYTISCFAKECRGLYPNEVLMNLVKNGTVTEECFKYSSENQFVETCPNKCNKNTVEFKKKYAKNAYLLEDYSQEDYYNIVELIIDQLITEGPVVGSVTLYDDIFFKLNKSICTDDYIYSYDGKSLFRGGHMVVIVGYGFLNNKYYWIVQNSWGKTFCNNGFVKIEFGQIGIEDISFAYPYLENQSKNVKVNVKFDSLNANSKCELKVSENLPSDKDNWDNTLEIIFQNDKADTINYQCGVNYIIKKGKIINCYFQSDSIKSEGTYIFKNYSTIGTGNVFNLIGFEGKSFYMYGRQILEPFRGPNKSEKTNFYVSGKGSSIIFNAETLKKFTSNPKIYAGNNKMKNCKINNSIKKDNFYNYYLMICTLEYNENRYFDYTQIMMANSYLCGNNFYSTGVLVSRLDESKYPIFKVKGFTSSYVGYNFKTMLAYITAEIKGSVSGYQQSNNAFETLIDFDYEENDVKLKMSKVMSCQTGIPSKKVKDYQIMCRIENKEMLKMVNLILHPVYWITQYNIPFEIIMDKSYIVNSSVKYVNIYLLFILSIILLD